MVLVLRMKRQISKELQLQAKQTDPCTVTHGIKALSHNSELAIISTLNDKGNVFYCLSLNGAHE